MSRSFDSPGRRLISRLERLDRGLGAGQTGLVVGGIVLVLVVGGVILANLDQGSGGSVSVVGVGMLLAVGALVGALLRRSRRSVRETMDRGGPEPLEARGPSNGRLRHRLTPDEVVAARHRREEGFDWEDICRLVVPGYAWWSPSEKLVFRNHLESEVSRPS